MSRHVRQAVTAAAFALTAGNPSDARAVLHLDPGPDVERGGRRVLLGVEPLEPSARGFELASLALSVLRDQMAAGGGLPPAVALTRAFASANAALLAENRPLAGCRWDRRVYVGATAVVVTGRTLTIAQVPATQALVVQDRRLYAFPDLASWCPTYLPPTDRPEPDPLGCREETRPLLYHTVAAPGDLVLLCSSAVARHLARDAAAGAAPHPEELLRGGNLEAALERLGEVVVAHEIDDAFAAGVVVDRLPAPGGALGGTLRDGLGRLGAAWSGWAPTAPRHAARMVWHARIATDVVRVAGPARGLGPAILGGRDWASAAAPLGHPATPVGGAVARVAPRDVAVQLLPAASGTAWPVGQEGREATGGNSRVRRLFAALTRTGAPQRRSPSPTAGWQRVPITPGAASVNRYTDRTPPPPEWRTNLPRGPEVHVPNRLMTVVLLVFLTFGGSGLALERRHERVTRLDAALSDVDGQLRVAAAAPPDAPAALVRADSALAQADAAGAPVEILTTRRYAIDQAFDRALGVGRLSAVTRLGALPRELASRPVQLVRAGREVYLVGGGLYRIAPEERRLVRLLAPGADVDGTPVGELRVAAADGDGLIVTDGAALYARDDDSTWTRRPLGGTPMGSAMMPAAAFEGNFYVLDEDGSVIKYADGAPSGGDPVAPTTWTDAAAAPELADARDLVVDGRVRVLLADGRVLSFAGGTLETTVAPAVSPPLRSPICLDGGQDAAFLYLADAGAAIGSTAGRIVRLDADGDAWQILPPSPAGGVASVEAAHALARARDLVVDEAAGVVYFVTDRDLWRATLPAGPDDGAV